MDRAVSDLQLYGQILSWCETGRPFAHVLILRAEGSTPAKAGTEALIGSDGGIVGTAGGGTLEAEIQRRGREACARSVPTVFDFHSESTEVQGAAPLCGGWVRVLLDPGAHRHAACFKEALKLLKERKRGIFITAVSLPGGEIERHVVPSGALFEPTARVRQADLQESLKKEKALYQTCGRDLRGQHTEVLIKPIIPKPLLLIAGGGHIGQALAHQASLVGFQVVVIDDRKEFVAPELYPPEVERVCGEIPGELAARAHERNTYVVIVTRGHRLDAEALKACIHSHAAYIGMIGSRRKVSLLREHFLKEGAATVEEFDRVYAPVGLPIGAVTVPEIAASIVAQLICARRKGSCDVFRFSP